MGLLLFVGGCLLIFGLHCQHQAAMEKLLREKVWNDIPMRLDFLKSESTKYNPITWDDVLEVLELRGMMLIDFNTVGTKLEWDESLMRRAKDYISRQEEKQE